MSGSGGKLGWAWIFILVSHYSELFVYVNDSNSKQEGLATVLAGIASYWIIADFPDTASFLNERERAQVIYRLKQDSQKSAAGEDFSWKRVLEAFFDVKTLLAMVVYMGKSSFRLDRRMC